MHVGCQHISWTWQIFRLISSQLLKVGNSHSVKHQALSTGCGVTWVWRKLGSGCRDSKSEGGVIGLTRKKSALIRWTLTRHIMGEYTQVMKERSGQAKSGHGTGHEEMKPTSTKRDWKHVEAGARERFFSWGGGKSVDMPSDCQILGGGTGISIPLRQKVGGQLPPLPPPPAPAPLRRRHDQPRTSKYDWSIWHRDTSWHPDQHRHWCTCNSRHPTVIIVCQEQWRTSNEQFCENGVVHRPTWQLLQPNHQIWCSDFLRYGQEIEISKWADKDNWKFEPWSYPPQCPQHC